MSAIAPLLEDKRTSNATDLTASIYEYTTLAMSAAMGRASSSPAASRPPAHHCGMAASPKSKIRAHERMPQGHALPFPSAAGR